MRENKGKSQEFLDYLSQSLARIENLCDSSHDSQCRSFKKTLLFSFIDGLSALVDSEERKRSHPRKSAEFRKTFIIKLGQWKDGALISTPHLCRWIELNPTGLTEEGIKLAQNHLKRWEEGCLIDLSDDINHQLIDPHINTNIKASREQIQGLTHASLLWNQRNSLIHDFAHNGVNLEFPDDTSPYYISLSSLDTGEAFDRAPTWQLIYPTGFLLRLARTCLESVTNELKINPVDPRACYDTGFYLRKSLNNHLKLNR